MIALLLNHLWQSSLCVAGAGLLALTLHRDGANVRFWLWFAASVKFLVPFAVLIAAGATLLAPIVPPLNAPAVALIEPLAKPFFSPATSMALTMTPSDAAVIALTTANPAPALVRLDLARLDLESVLLAAWMAGVLIIVFRWFVRWSRVRALLRDAVMVRVDAPIAVKFSSSRLEPGLVGILRPVILLPQGIEQQLSAVELKAVLAHELCHWRRHDNLLAAIHMLVEALFWFFPLVWWLGARLNAERERACDESVLAQGNDPQLYAEGILKVCRAYLQSPLACVAGVSGAGLKQRIDQIMENRLIPRLNAMRKLVLSASAGLVLVPPLLLGLAAVPVAQMQAKAATPPDALRDAGLNEDRSNKLPGQRPTRQIGAVRQSQTDSTVPESAPKNSADLPELPPIESSETPTVLAANDTPAATPGGQPITPPAAQAQPSEPSLTAADPATVTALRCLLLNGQIHGQRGCGAVFVGMASRSASPWLRRDDPNRDFELGPLISADYAGSKTGDSVYITKLLSGRTTDLYDVKFKHHRKTFYIARPAPDGMIHFMLVRDGGPDDERHDLFVRGPG